MLDDFQKADPTKKVLMNYCHKFHYFWNENLKNFEKK